jgi:hypothetical protein
MPRRIEFAVHQAVIALPGLDPGIDRAIQ